MPLVLRHLVGFLHHFKGAMWSIRTGRIFVVMMGATMITLLKLKIKAWIFLMFGQKNLRFIVDLLARCTVLVLVAWNRAFSPIV